VKGGRRLTIKWEAFWGNKEKREDGFEGPLGSFSAKSFPGVLTPLSHLSCPVSENLGPCFSP
jgi:hypothetical protein